MWTWVTNNITTIKDILWIVFTLAATIVAILTYRRARHTLLQPLRTEVIKRQTDLLIELLDFLYNGNLDLHFKIDYIGLITHNTLILMDDYGFVFKDTNREEIKNQFSGVLILKKSGSISSIELPSIFTKNNSSKNVEKEKIDESKDKYFSAKHGNVDLEILRLTQSFVGFKSELKRFIDNPFMPTDIKKLLLKLNEDIEYNLKIVMKETLEDFIVQLCTTEHDFYNDNSLNIHLEAIYNNFQRKSIHHQTVIDSIRETTREYLKIDQKWT